MRRAFAALFTALLPLLAQAQVIEAADAREIRAVVQAQLDAFQRDDATGAFSYATGGIRRTFGTPENFMAMVRSQYPAVYRPAKVVFEAPTRIAGDLVQPVRLTDAEGRQWLAIYSMLREHRAWRIAGCHLTRIARQET